jgi:hypothetical protein
MKGISSLPRVIARLAVGDFIISSHPLSTCHVSPYHFSSFFSFLFSFLSFSPLSRTPHPLSFSLFFLFLSFSLFSLMHEPLPFFPFIPPHTQARSPPFLLSLLPFVFILSSLTVTHAHPAERVIGEEGDPMDLCDPSFGGEVQHDFRRL